MVLRFKTRRRIHDSSYEVKISIFIRKVLLEQPRSFICVPLSATFPVKGVVGLLQQMLTHGLQKLNTLQAKFACPPLKAMLLSQGQFCPWGHLAGSGLSSLVTVGRDAPDSPCVGAWVLLDVLQSPGPPTATRDQRAHHFRSV